MAKNFLAAISWYLVLKDQYIKKVMRVDWCSQSLQVPSVLVHNQSNVMNQPTPAKAWCWTTFTGVVLKASETKTNF